MEYQQLLHDDNWTRAETDHLFDLARRFDLRFIVIKDRWDDERFPNRSVEDLKERFYNIDNILAKVGTILSLLKLLGTKTLNRGACIVIVFGG